MGKPKRNLELNAITPIPADKAREWRELITKSKTIVKSIDKGQFELIKLAAQVENEYGEKNVQRWAEEIGLNYNTARMYRFLGRKGVNDEFVKRFCQGTKPLGYAVIREIVTFCGGVTQTAEQYLEYARKHNASARLIRAYMIDQTSPYQHKEESAEAYKIMLRDKQKLEGFSDVVLHGLERTLEKNPELEQSVQENAFTDVESIIALKEAAGILTKEEQKLVDEARHYMTKIRNQYRWMRDNQKSIVSSIVYNHELSGPLKAQIQQMYDALTKILESDPEYIPADTDSVEIDV